MAFGDDAKRNGRYDLGHGVKALVGGQIRFGRKKIFGMFQIQGIIGNIVVFGLLSVRHTGTLRLVV